MSAVLAMTPERATDPLAHAVQNYIRAKRDEDAATAVRLEAEQRILALHPAPEQGSETIEAGGFKLTLTGKLSYKCVDPRALAEHCVASGWPTERIPVKTETKLDETGCKWLRAHDPQAWGSLAEHITVKPAKTSFTVKV